MIIESPAEKSGFLFGVAPSGDELLGRDCEGTSGADGRGENDGWKQENGAGNHRTHCMAWRLMKA